MPRPSPYLPGAYTLFSPSVLAQAQEFEGQSHPNSIS